MSPPPSPPREERPVVPQPGVGLEEAQEQLPIPVRLEIIGVGEEDEIVELEELQLRHTCIRRSRLRLKKMDLPLPKDPHFTPVSI